MVGGVEPPAFCGGFGEFVLERLTFQEDRGAGRVKMAIGEATEDMQGRKGAGGDDIGMLQGGRFDALCNDAGVDADDANGLSQEDGFALVGFDERDTAIGGGGGEICGNDKAREAAA